MLGNKDKEYDSVNSNCSRIIFQNDRGLLTLTLNIPENNRVNNGCISTKNNK